MTTPAARQMALEYQIWAFASPRGWNVTPGEIAEELGVGLGYVVHALRRKGWLRRVRGSLTFGRFNGLTLASDHFADDVAHGRINMSVE